MTPLSLYLDTFEMKGVGWSPTGPLSAGWIGRHTSGGPVQVKGGASRRLEWARGEMFCPEW